MRPRYQDDREAARNMFESEPDIGSLVPHDFLWRTLLYVGELQQRVAALEDRAAAEMGRRGMSKTDPELAREEAALIKPAEWQEGDKTFFYPTLDNHQRYALHDLLIRMAEEIERLTDLVNAYGEREESIIASYSELVRNIDKLRAGEGRSYTTILTGERGYVTIDATRSLALEETERARLGYGDTETIKPGDADG